MDIKEAVDVEEVEDVEGVMGEQHQVDPHHHQVVIHHTEGGADTVGEGLTVQLWYL